MINHLDSTCSAVLSQLEAFGLENDRHALDRSQRMMNLARPTAELLFILLTATRRQRVLEIGTSNGYSAIWIACAMRGTGGQPLITIDCQPHKIEKARANLQSAAVQDWVHVIEGDATRICATLPGPFDCVFFDADRVSAPRQLDHLLPRLTEDALLLTDNVLSHPDEVAEYIARVEALQQFDSVTIPVGKGLHIAHRRVRS